MHLKYLQGLVDKVAQILPLSLRIIHAVSQVQLLLLEDVENGEDLSVGRHESLSDHLTAKNKCLDNLEHRADDLRIARVQGGLDRHDELRNDGQDLRSALIEHVVSALDGKEAVRVLFLACAVEEDGQVVVV